MRKAAFDKPLQSRQHLVLMANQQDSSAPSPEAGAHDPAGVTGAATRSGGRVAAKQPDPAFTFVARGQMPLPVLIAVPHAGRAYFAELTEQMRAVEQSQLRLEDRHVDHLGLALAERTGSALLVAHAPRAMIDLNRDETDVDWDMIEGPNQMKPIRTTVGSVSNHRSRSGLGLVPRRLPGFGEIWRSRLPRGELDRRIEEIHQPYHQMLSDELARIRDIWGAALLIDLHSMPPLQMRDSDLPAPVMVLGDRFGASCHHSLMTGALQLLASRRVNASQNRPYSGGYVLDRHGAPESGIHAVQVEICRSLYLDESWSELSSKAVRVTALLAALVQELGTRTAALGQGRQMLEAAE